MRAWSKDDDEIIIRMLGLGKSRAEIACHFGVTKNAILGKIHRIQRGHRKPRKRTEWTDEMKDRHRSMLIELTQKAILHLLLRGGNHTAQEIEGLVKYEAGRGYIWEALINMERDRLVWRAQSFADPFDWRKANHWEITGCGRVVAAGQQTPGA